MNKEEEEGTTEKDKDGGKRHTRGRVLRADIPH